MSTIPDALPTLSKGSHKPHEGLACVMEYVSVLAGEAWTDQPKCTHPALAQMAILTNDWLDDRTRSLMIPLIGRLFGTRRGTNDKRINRRLAYWGIEYAHKAGWIDEWEAKGMQQDTRRGENDDALDLAVTLEEVLDYNTARRDDGTQHLAFLTALLDEYDRITGRNTTPEVTDQMLANLRHAVEQQAVTV